MLKVFFAVTGLIVLAVLVSACAGYIALNVMPCSWFGSGSEGACGYGALFFVLAATPVLALALSVTFIVLYFRARNKAAASRNPGLT